MDTTATGRLRHDNRATTAPDRASGTSSTPPRRLLPWLQPGPSLRPGRPGRLAGCGSWAPRPRCPPGSYATSTEVDHHDHEAIGALSAADGRGVGIARYIRDADDPQAAEMAVTIVDGWQGRGLGTELFSRLSERARQAGIHRFTALVAAENVAAAGLLRNLGACLAGRGPGTSEYQVALVPAEYGLDWWFGCVDGLAQPGS